MNEQSVVVVIPTYEPDIRLLELLQDIRTREARPFRIILVDDGSGDDYKDIFKEAQTTYHCRLLTHEVNKGKGRALKTAILDILKTLPEAKGIVTIDSDGQHTYEDTLKCIQAFFAIPRQFDFGCSDL